jgi:hypothetical protein
MRVLYFFSSVWKMPSQPVYVLCSVAKGAGRAGIMGFIMRFELQLITIHLLDWITCHHDVKDFVK